MNLRFLLFALNSCVWLSIHPHASKLSPRNLLSHQKSSAMKLTCKDLTQFFSNSSNTVKELPLILKSCKLAINYDSGAILCEKHNNSINLADCIRQCIHRSDLPLIIEKILEKQSGNNNNNVPLGNIDTMILHVNNIIIPPLIHQLCAASNGPVISWLAKRDALNPLLLYTDKQMNTAWHYVHTQECAQVLIKSGIPILQQNEYGDTALHIATRKGHCDIMQTLLLAGADPNILNNEKKVPLHDLGKNPLESAAILLAFHASLRIKDEYGRAPLSYIPFAPWPLETRLVMARLFIAAGASTKEPLSSLRKCKPDKYEKFEELFSQKEIISARSLKKSSGSHEKRKTKTKREKRSSSFASPHDDYANNNSHGNLTRASRSQSTPDGISAFIITSVACEVSSKYVPESPISAALATDSEEKQLFNSH